MRRGLVLLLLLLPAAFGFDANPAVKGHGDNQLRVVMAAEGRYEATPPADAPRGSTEEPRVNPILATVAALAAVGAVATLAYARFRRPEFPDDSS